MRTYGLPVLLIVYGLASLFHHIHNAVFLDAYPNMPAWLSSAGVYAAWLGVAAVGLSGYLLFRYVHQLLGLAVMALYGGLGLDGLGHYSLAPFSAHTVTMNMTIWLEVVTAVVLLIAVAGLMVMRLRRGSRLSESS